MTEIKTAQKTIMNSKVYLKRALCALLAAIIIAAWPPTHTTATTDSISSGRFTIYVDGNTFEPWGYVTDWAVLYLSLNDIAYMLSGTGSQFDIRTPPDERWDFWIVRGEEYTPTGNEFQYVPDRRLWVDSPFLFGDNYPTGWGYWPMHTLFIGVDGQYEPEATVAIRVVMDESNYYFSVDQLSDLFGFSILFTNDHWGEIGIYVEGYDYMIETQTRPPAEIPAMTPETARLLSRLHGHWVDREHLFSEEINETVVWPAEFEIRHQGVAEPLTSVAPQIEGWRSSTWMRARFWAYPVSSRELGNGLVELSIGDSAIQVWYFQERFSMLIEYYELEVDLHSPAAFSNQRIVFDTATTDAYQLTLYIGENRHIMYRISYPHFVEDALNRPRHTASPAACGGITVRYVLHSWAFSGLKGWEILVYRSQIEGELGNPILRQYLYDPYDRLLFEFTDATAERGNVYYYTILSPSPDSSHSRYVSGWNIQLRVDTNEIHLAAETDIKEHDSYAMWDASIPEDAYYDDENADQPEVDRDENGMYYSDSNGETGSLWLLLFLIPVCLIVWAAVRRKSRNAAGAKQSEIS